MVMLQTGAAGPCRRGGTCLSDRVLLKGRLREQPPTTFRNRPPKRKVAAFNLQSVADSIHKSELIPRLAGDEAAVFYDLGCGSPRVGMIGLGDTFDHASLMEPLDPSFQRSPFLTLSLWHFNHGWPANTPVRMRSVDACSQHAHKRTAMIQLFQLLVAIGFGAVITGLCVVALMLTTDPGRKGG